MTEDFPLKSINPDGDNGLDSAEVTGVHSLKELLDRVTGREFHPAAPALESGLAEALPFPFLALVGQLEMKTALLLSLINPAVGGVLLIGPPRDR